jgi:hypothetical protein
VSVFSTTIKIAGTHPITALKRDFVPTTWPSYAVHLDLWPTPPIYLYGRKCPVRTRRVASTAVSLDRGHWGRWRG